MSLIIVDKPTLRCLVAFPLCADVFSEPAVVSVELAVELHARGYMVLGPDPEDEGEYARWLQAQHALGVNRKWFEAPD